MGCASSSFLEEDGKSSCVAGGAGSSGFKHHIVSLTSTTYGLLTTFDNPNATLPPPPPPPPLPSLPPSISRLNLHSRSEPEIINSWELMEGLDYSTGIAHSSNIGDMASFCFPTDPHWKPKVTDYWFKGFEGFEKRCPPGGENSVVIYTTTLRGIRKTFEDCNTVRSLVEGTGVWVKERDVSMDIGFREELRELMKGSPHGCTVPRLFVRGMYIGGVEEVMKIHEEGTLGNIFEGLPKVRSVGEPCDGCGGAKFLPCFRCCGGRKVVLLEVILGKETGMVARCPDCNENGLVLCPICC
ncbi:Glutaredoxin family protein [Zostera marina]|uniref:Glutaredoxin family protein n=1 Tax=Zostera marina TaxID=29655 RepID=A0A0K9PMV8_ZOSMR|nr:Glutaredoxin family protein [Zostera marina]